MPPCKACARDGTCGELPTLRHKGALVPDEEGNITPHEGCAVGLSGCVFLGFALMIIAVCAMCIVAYW